jgi:hypothetical protein
VDDPSIRLWEIFGEQNVNIVKNQAGKNKNEGFQVKYATFFH